MAETEKLLETPRYAFRRGRRAILAEVLFPKKVAYQPEIFRALKGGLEKERVKAELRSAAGELLQEMQEYPQLFDPDQYNRNRMPRHLDISIEEAQRRLDMYESHFHGWSMYEVDGMFEGVVAGTLYEERTQVIRLIFRLDSEHEETAKAEGCYDVLESLMRWVMAEPYRLDHILPWSKSEKNRFLKLHSTWPRHKRTFLDKHYEPLTKEIKKWIDDAGLFVFGYLVRRFWKEVLVQALEEEEIWVVNWFNVNLNIVKRTS